MAETIEAMLFALRRLRFTVLLGCYTLVGFFAAVAVLSLEIGLPARLFIWFLQSLPLLLFLPGLHRCHLRTYLWCSLAALIYFVHGVMVAFEPARRWTGLVEILLCALLFAGLILFLRRFRQHYGVPL